jgi:hypothetical protein
MRNLLKAKSSRAEHRNRKLKAACRTFFEGLESRRLLTVTIDNQLSSGSPDFFSVVVDAGGSTNNTSFGGTDTIYNYAAFLDLGNGSPVVSLAGVGSDPVLNPDGSVHSEGTITTANGSIAFAVDSSIPSGSKSFFNKFSFTATGFDLTGAKLFQYMDSDILSISDDVLKVDGTTGGTGANKLILTNIDPATNIRQAQSDGAVSQGASLTGWAADQFDELEAAIIAGGFDAAVGGTVDTTSLPPTTVTGIGAVYGPEDITTALEYSFSSAGSASVTTVLGIDTVAAVAPEIDVKGNGTSILSGDVTPSTGDFTDFGSSPVGVGVANTFAIANIGNQNLVLSGTPLVEITGADAGDFTITSQPSTPIAGAGSSNTIITFTPSADGLRTATVTIVSNDANEGTYSFTIQGTGGEGGPVLPVLTINDVSKNEGDSGTTEFTFTVTRTGDLTGVTTVQFATADGTASSSSDFASIISGELTFAAGESTKTVTVLVKGDTTNEANETFFVNLSAATGATVSDAQGKGTILNDDGVQPPTGGHHHHRHHHHRHRHHHAHHRARALTVDFTTIEGTGGGMAL